MFDDGKKTKSELLPLIRDARPKYLKERSQLFSEIQERRELKKKYPGLELKTKGLKEHTRVDLFECSDEVFEQRLVKLKRLSDDEVGGIFNNIEAAFNIMRSWKRLNEDTKIDPDAESGRKRSSGMIMSVGSGHKKKIYHPGNSD